MYLGSPSLGSGGKVDLVVKSLVIEWLGLEGGLRRPILGGPEALLWDREEQLAL